MKKSKSTSKSVWLINQYLCTSELNDDGHRHSFLAEKFIKKGYEVTLITSSFSHVPHRENNFKGLFKVLNGDIRTLLIKGNKYKSTQGVSRVLSWLIFCFLLFFIPTKKIPKPDVIIVSSNSLLPILNVVFYFKRKFKGVKFILEIRDIWPLSLVELGGFSAKNPMIKLLAWVEKLGYQKADHIVSLLIDCNKHIKQIIPNQKFNYTWVSNGYQLEEDAYYQSISEAMQAKIPEGKFIIGYAGSLGKANAMEYLIDAVKEIKESDVYLCIVGNGDEKQNLIKRASGVKNILFFDKIAKKQVVSFLKKCDLLYFASKESILYSYGISANKTFDYMYAKKPILLSAPVVNSAVDEGNCGVVIAPENSEAISNQILKFKSMTIAERTKYGKNGKEYLLNNLTYEKLANKFITVFKSLDC